MVVRFSSWLVVSENDDVSYLPQLLRQCPPVAIDQIMTRTVWKRESTLLAVPVRVVVIAPEQPCR